MKKEFQEDEQCSDNSFISQNEQFIDFIDQGDEWDITRSVSQQLSLINTACSKSIRSLNQIATNIVYNAKHSSCPLIQRKKIELKDRGEAAYLLGKKYKNVEKQEQFLQAFQSIIWISYRAEDEKKLSDAGWGCMIRVCQMVLAESLKRCCKNKHASQIFKQFSSSQEALFSFDKICQKGNIYNRWTCSAEIIGILTDMMKSQKKFNLSILLYNTQVSEEDQEDEEKYPMLFVVTNRLGQKKAEEKYHKHLFLLLQHPNSVGMIGGIGGEAIYVVGYFQKSFISLDPHYVQSQDQGVRIHYKSTPRGVPADKIMPSVGFCFYFSTKKQHQQWLQDMAQLYYLFTPNTAIQMQLSYCQRIYEKYKPKSQSSQEFQTLQ